MCMCICLQAIEKVINEEMEGVKVPDEPYFVDFLQDAPEPTGDEPDDADLDAPKIYEQVHYVTCTCIYALYM